VEGGGCRLIVLTIASEANARCVATQGRRGGTLTYALRGGLLERDSPRHGRDQRERSSLGVAGSGPG